MQKFSIRDIENLTGIKAHTLRIWEQRYHFIVPKRKQRGHRYYDNDDLKNLLRVSFLYHSGWKISKIAQLSADEINKLIVESETTKENYGKAMLSFFEAAIEFDAQKFSANFDKLSEEIGFEKCITDVCYPFLKRIGLLWVTNNIIPAQEHFCSFIIQHKIFAAIDKLPAEKAERETILLYTPNGEHHELPLLYLNYLLKKNGWRTIYLGSNRSLENIDEVMQKTEVDYILFRLITNFTGFEINDYLEKLCKKYSNKTIVASGKYVHLIQRTFLNLIILKSDADIYDFIHQRTSSISAAHR